MPARIPHSRTHAAVKGPRTDASPTIAGGANTGPDAPRVASPRSSQMNERHVLFEGLVGSSEVEPTRGLIMGRLQGSVGAFAGNSSGMISFMSVVFVIVE